MKHKTIVLVVEDETMLLSAIKKKLETEGFEAICCPSASEALDFLKTTEDLPDIVWLDYYLKDMNGIEFMNALKANEKWANIPVMVVSNSASTEKVNNMLALGAKMYILKAENKLDDIVSDIRNLV